MVPPHARGLPEETSAKEASVPQKSRETPVGGSSLGIAIPGPAKPWVFPLPQQWRAPLERRAQRTSALEQISAIPPGELGSVLTCNGVAEFMEKDPLPS